MPDLAQLREAALRGVEGLEEATAHAPRARRNLLIGLWAGQLLGHAGSALAHHALSVMEADHEEAGDADVIRKLSRDFAAAGVPVPEAELHERLVGFKRAAYAAINHTD